MTPQSGFSGAVNLQNTALATGETATFAPSSVSGGSGTSTLTVNTDAQSTPSGQIGFTVIGVGQQGGGWVETQASATLDVEHVVATPAFSPGAGTYTSGQTVTISTTTTASVGLDSLACLV